MPHVFRGNRTMASASARSKYQRMLQLQRESAWDLETDLDWSGLAAGQALLPCPPSFGDMLGLDQHERLAVSQLLGLMAVQAIAEHERVMGAVQDLCWRLPVRKAGLSPDVIALGDQFFAEEAKHARAFGRYVETFASVHGIPRDALAAILPTYSHDSWFTRLFRANARFGGRAIWWLVLMTEEESIDLHRRIGSSGTPVEPLFRRLNELHFEEERRHSGYSPLMLRTLSAPSTLLGRVLARTDYAFAVVLHAAWVLCQMRRATRVAEHAHRHPFFAAVASVFTKLNRKPVLRRLTIVLNEVPYASELLRPGRHPGIRAERSRGVSPRSSRLPWLPGFRREEMLP